MKTINLLTDLVPYGKYTGKSIGYIMDNDLPYAEWMINNMKCITFTQGIKQKINWHLHLAN